MSGPPSLPPPGVCTPDQLLPNGEPMLATPCMKWTNEQAKAAAPPPAPPKDEAQVPAKGEAAEAYSFFDDPARWVRETFQEAVNAISPFDEVGEAIDGALHPKE